MAVAATMIKKVKIPRTKKILSERFSDGVGGGDFGAGVVGGSLGIFGKAQLSGEGKSGIRNSIYQSIVISHQVL